MWDGEDTVRRAIVKPLGRLEFRTAESRGRAGNEAGPRIGRPPADPSPISPRTLQGSARLRDGRGGL